MLAINFLVCVVYVWVWVLCGVREFEGGGGVERESLEFMIKRQ